MGTPGFVGLYRVCEGMKMYFKMKKYQYIFSHPKVHQDKSVRVEGSMKV